MLFYGAKIKKKKKTAIEMMKYFLVFSLHLSTKLAET
jgi:hypothetical protein